MDFSDEYETIWGAGKSTGGNFTGGNSTEGATPETNPLIDPLSVSSLQPDENTTLADMIIESMSEKTSPNECELVATVPDYSHIEEEYLEANPSQDLRESIADLKLILAKQGMTDNTNSSAETNPSNSIVAPDDPFELAPPDTCIVEIAPPPAAVRTGRPLKTGGSRVNMQKVIQAQRVANVQSNQVNTYGRGWAAPTPPVQKFIDPAEARKKELTKINTEALHKAIDTRGISPDIIQTMAECVEGGMTEPMLKLMMSRYGQLVAGGNVALGNAPAQGGAPGNVPTTTSGGGIDMSVISASVQGAVGTEMERGFEMLLNTLMESGHTAQESAANIGKQLTAIESRITPLSTQLTSVTTKLNDLAALSLCLAKLAIASEEEREKATAAVSAQVKKMEPPVQSSYYGGGLGAQVYNNYHYPVNKFTGSNNNSSSSSSSTVGTPGPVGTAGITGSSKNPDADESFVKKMTFIKDGKLCMRKAAWGPNGELIPAPIETCDTQTVQDLFDGI